MLCIIHHDELTLLRRCLQNVKHKINNSLLILFDNFSFGCYLSYSHKPLKILKNESLKINLTLCFGLDALYFPCSFVNDSLRIVKNCKARFTQILALT